MREARDKVLLLLGVQFERIDLLLDRAGHVVERHGKIADLVERRHARAARIVAAADDLGEPLQAPQRLCGEIGDKKHRGDRHRNGDDMQKNDGIDLFCAKPHQVVRVVPNGQEVVFSADRHAARRIQDGAVALADQPVRKPPYAQLGKRQRFRKIVHARRDERGVGIVDCAGRFYALIGARAL